MRDYGVGTQIVSGWDLKLIGVLLSVFYMKSRPTRSSSSRLVDMSSGMLGRFVACACRARRDLFQLPRDSLLPARPQWTSNTLESVGRFSDSDGLPSKEVLASGLNQNSFWVFGACSGFVGKEVDR